MVTIFCPDCGVENIIHSLAVDRLHYRAYVVVERIECPECGYRGQPDVEYPPPGDGPTDPDDVASRDDVG